MGIRNTQGVLRPRVQEELVWSKKTVKRATVLEVFAVLFVVSFFFRIFYVGSLLGDDGLWFTAAEEILRGKALYREIIFDKPPALPIVYAALFKVFGTHILTIRLFTIFYSVAISAVLYFFGSYLYNKRAGLIAAAMFTVFSTTYFPEHMQSLSTDFLMVLPYTAGALVLIRSGADLIRGSMHISSGKLAFAGGSLVGVAFQTNPKGAFDLIFFAILLILTRVRGLSETEPSSRHILFARSTNPWTSVRPGRPARQLFALALAGFVSGNLPFLIYVAGTHSLLHYWSNVWDWGARYVSYFPVLKITKGLLYHGLGYLAVNNLLLIALLFLIAVTTRKAYRGFRQKSLTDTCLGDTDSPSGSKYNSDQILTSDATMLVWFSVSWFGVMIGGRFFGHYYFQILPSLCLIGARGLLGITFSVRRWRWQLRQAVFAILIVGFLFTLVRWHGRTAMLAAEWIRGKKSARISSWLEGDTNPSDRVMAMEVRDIPDPASAVDSISIEPLRADGPRNRPIQGPADYLFVWGYRPQIYYYSGLIPASRYISTQPLTGVPADSHYNGKEYRVIVEDELTSGARAELIRDLEQTEPKYIIDDLGMYNAALAISEFPDLRAFMSKYRRVNLKEPFIIFIRRDLRKKRDSK